MSRRLLRLSLLLAPALALAASAPLQRPEEIPPSDAVVRFAAEHGIPLERFDPPRADGRALPGDLAVALLNLRDGTERKQWLVQFSLAAPTAQDLRDHPAGDLTLNATSGRTYRFAASNRLAVDIHIVGPFAAGQRRPPDEKRGRAVISADLLGIGLDETCRTLLKLNPPSAGKAGTASTAASSGPAPVVPAAALSEAEERALFGFVPTLGAFLQTVQNTPGLREILWDLLKKPSVWTFLKHRGGIDLNLDLNGPDAVSPVEPLTWAPVATPLYRMSPVLSIYGKPALRCALIVTAPRPPLLTTGGIIGLAATPPDSSDKRLDVRIVAVRQAPAP